MIGNIFSVWIDIVPFSSTMVVEIYCCLLHELRRITRIHCSSIACSESFSATISNVRSNRVLFARLTEKEGAGCKTRDPERPRLQRAASSVQLFQFIPQNPPFVKRKPQIERFVLESRENHPNFTPASS